jgi:hypothetical protein
VRRMARGDHIYARRGRRYSHHGIDCGDGTVIHYAGPRGTVRRIARTAMPEFASGSIVQVRTYRSRLAAELTVRNAESRLGEPGYHLLRNNCEHFAAWCCTGRAASTQVRRWSVATQGTLASVAAAESLGLHMAFLAGLGAGLYACTAPFRRRRRRPAVR